MLRTERCTFCYDRCFRCFGKREFLTPNGTYISHARDVHSFVFLTHITATLYMTGLIWFVQIVHYPLFSRVGNAEFPAYEQRHTVLTTWVVGPPMLVEGITALILIWLRPGGVTGASLDRSQFAGRHLDFHRLCPGTLSRRVVAGIRQNNTSATGSHQLAQDVSLELTCPAGALDGVGDTVKCWQVRPAVGPQTTRSYVSIWPASVGRSPNHTRTARASHSVRL